MRTVILRLSDPVGDGQLHGRLEVVGDDLAVAFTDDADLLTQLHRAAGSVPADAAVPADDRA